MEKMTEHMNNRFNGKNNFSLQPPLPDSLNIELNNTCNQRCLFCEFHGPHAPKLNNCVMDYELVREILFKSHELGIGRKEVGFYAFGEVFLYEKFPDVVHYAKELGYSYTFVTTNGALANPNRMKAVVDAGIDSIRFSVNAGERDVYKEIHGADDFDRVIENIKCLHEYRNQIDRNLNVSLSFVLTKKTLNQIPKVKEIFEPLVDEIVYLPVMFLGNLKEDLTEELLVPDELLETKKDDSYICPFVFNTMYIQASGQVIFCCHTLQEKISVAKIESGNFDLEKIWYSDAYHAYRKAFLEHDLRGTVCERCEIIIKGTPQFVTQETFERLVH